MQIRKAEYRRALSDCPDWVNIQDYEDLYEVHWRGYVRSKRKNILLKAGLAGNGYLTVSLKNGTSSKTFTIHSLVARHFIPNPEDKRCVNHKSGNKRNNHISNLEWNTHQENNRHAYINGLRKGRPARGVIQMDMQGNEVARHHSSEIPGFHCGCICLVARGKRDSHRGFKWKYIR